MSIEKFVSPQVDILLGTFQGEPYLEELLQSIFSQTYDHFRILVRDDGSTDKTIKILNHYSQLYPNKICLLPFTANLGVKKNFSELLKHAQAPYVMFADQDDYWLPHKIERSLQEIKKLEMLHGTNQPLLVHTDLTVVDHQLKTISDSFWKFAHINPFSFQLNRLLTQNVFTGCTLLFNRSLAKMAYPIPEDAMMHDWWVGLIASCFGFIQIHPKSTILYRQHSDNQVGAKKYSLLLGLKKLSPAQIDLSQSTFSQAQSFLECFYQRLHDHPLQIHLLKTYSRLGRLPYLSQKYLLLRNQFFKQGFLRNLKNLLFKQIS